MADNEYSIVIPMPFNGESIVDGIIVGWMVKVGDLVKKGQPLAEIETEKSVWQFNSPCNGEVTVLAAKEGDVIDVGAPLLEIRTADPDMKHLTKGETAKPEPQKGAVTAPTPHVDSTLTASSLLRSLSPRIRKMVTDAAISDADLLRIAEGTPDGKVTAAEIGRFLDAEEAKKAAGGFKTCSIVGLGTYVPKKVVDNGHFLEQFTDIDGDYIEKVTGIRERHWAETETTSDLGTEAAKAALDNAGLKATDIDLIIVSTTTPDMPLPAAANAIQQKLGCPLIPAFDIAAACSGWLYALSIGRQFVQTGTYTSVLVIAAEEMSKFTDKTDRATAFLFGDGAGAVVLSSKPGPKTGKGHVLSDMILKADSSGYDIIHRKAGGSEFPPGSGLEVADGFWFMDGGRMFRTAVEAFSSIIEAVADASGTDLADFAWIVPHQANQRILKSVAHKLKLPIEKFFVNIEKYGNTSAASIPLALKDLEATGLLKPGDRILLSAVGAGLTIAGGVITW